MWPPWLRNHPADWAPGTLDRAALQQAAATLRAEPGFDAQVRHFATCWQAAYDGSATLHAAMRDTPRYLLLVTSLRLAHVQAHPQAATAAMPLADHASGQIGRVHV